VAVVPGNPNTQAVSRFFPKVCAALQRKCGIDIEPVSAWFESVMRLRLIDEGAAGRVTRPALRFADQPCAIPLT